MSRRTSNRGTQQRQRQARKQKGRDEETETEVRGKKGKKEEEKTRKQEKLKVEGVQKKKRRSKESLQENRTRKKKQPDEKKEAATNSGERNMAKKRSASKDDGTPNAKKNKTRQVQRKTKVPGIPKKKAAEDDKEADKMGIVTGMTSFKEYNYSLMRATEVSVGQKWNEDGTGEVTVLRDKSGRTVATWTGREDKVGKDDYAMRVHESYVINFQETIDKIQRERNRHTLTNPKCGWKE